MSKSIQISDLSHLEFKSWSNVTYGKKICKGWGSRTFYRLDNHGNLHCKNFNLLQRIAHSFGQFGYKPEYSGKILLKHLQDKNIVKTPRKGRMDKLIAGSLKAFKVECQTEATKAICNEFIRQTNDPTVTDATLINFLKVNPDVSIHDKIDGLTIVFLAAKNKRLALLTHLVNQGADVNIRCDGTNEVSKTPLHAALEKSYLGMCEYLLNKGADINAQNAEGNTPAHLLIEMIAEHDSLPINTNNPKLHVDDIASGKIPNYLLGMVLDRNFDLNIVNYRHETILMKAIRLNLYYEVWHLMKNYTANVHFANAHGDNALTLAYEFATVGMANMLINQFGAQISTLPQAKNVLILAIKNAHICLSDIQRLINNNPQLVTDEAIIEAIKEDNHSLLDILLDDKTKIATPGALLALARVNDEKVIKKIVKAVTDDVVHNEGDEALVEAIKNKNIIVATEIIERYETCTPAKQITTPGALVALGGIKNNYLRKKIFKMVSDDLLQSEGDDALIKVINTEKPLAVLRVLGRYGKCTPAKQITSPGVLQALTKIDNYTIIENILRSITDDLVQSEGDNSLIEAINNKNMHFLDLMLNRYDDCKPAKKITSADVFLALAKITDDQIVLKLANATTDDVVHNEGDNALIACIHADHYAPVTPILQRYYVCKPSKIPSDRVFQAADDALKVFTYMVKDIKDELESYKTHVLNEQALK